MGRLATEKARDLFRRHGGILRTGEAIGMGIHPTTLYQMHSLGEIERITRGVYRLVGEEPDEYPDLVTVARAIPQGVICLVSALAFHNLTLQIPKSVDVAIPRGRRRPAIDYPPTHVFVYGRQQFDYGIEVHGIAGTEIKVYRPERAIVDCFKFRHKIGIDIGIEALKTYWCERRGNLDLLLDAAERLRMRAVIGPYLISVTEGNV